MSEIKNVHYSKVAPSHPSDVLKNPYNKYDSLFGLSKSSIDSLKIRIPLNKVKITSDILNDEFEVYSKTTGECINELSFKNSSHFVDNKGIKTYYRKESQVNKGGSKEFVTILLSSKTLRHNYFNGITTNTIYDVYNYISNEGVVKVDFEDFCAAECTDIDIKCDVVPRVDPQIIIKDLYERAIPKKRAIEGCSVYGNKRRSQKNLGIQFALRKTSLYRKAPYLKFYEKIRELRYKSWEFASHFIDFDGLPNNILRVETTIKNKDHLKYLKMELNSLIELCQNIDKLALAAFNHSMGCHLDMSAGSGYTDKIEAQNDFKPSSTDLLIKNFIKSEMKVGYSYRQSVERCLLFNNIDKHQRTRMKQRIKKLEVFKFIGSDLGFKKGSMDDFLKEIGF